MADSKPIIKMSMPEIAQLSDRPSERADKIENLTAQDLASDLRLASKTLQAMARSIHKDDAVTLDNGA